MTRIWLCLLPDEDNDDSDIIQISKTPKRKKLFQNLLMINENIYRESCPLHKGTKCCSKKQKRFRKDMTEAIRESTERF